MAYVGYPSKRAVSANSPKRWGVDGVAGKVALAASLLFVAIAILGL
ncbi:hypothetical protein [Rhizobium wuzhouense]|nr:hypothetical protein [Rhizobium wuzhouense]